MTKLAFFANAYLTYYNASDREVVEEKAASAATDALIAANVTFDEALSAEASRVNDDEFNDDHATAYGAALTAAHAAVATDIKGTSGFITLGWR